jgi:hypothetical protein
LEKQLIHKKEEVRNTKRTRRTGLNDFVNIKVADKRAPLLEVPSKTDEISKCDVIEKAELESKAGEIGKPKVTEKQVVRPENAVRE